MVSGLRVCCVACGLWLALPFSGCDSDRGNGSLGGNGGSVVGAAPAAGAYRWTSESNTTVKKPVFGMNCRPYRETILHRVSDGNLDDTLVLVEDASGPITVHLVVVDDGANIVDAAVEFLPSQPLHKAYTDGSGRVFWNFGAQSAGDVIFGTLCFETRLEAGVATRAEFGLIVDGDDGQPYSIGGSFSLDADVVHAMDFIQIDVDSLEIALE